MPPLVVLSTCLTLCLGLIASVAQAGPIQESASRNGNIQSPWQEEIWRGSGPVMRAYICRYATQRPGWCDEKDREPSVHPLIEPEVQGPNLTAEDARWQRLLRSADPDAFTASDREFITRRAEETFDPAAMEILGYLHARGIGVPRDPEAAYIWYGRAFLAGETGVKKNMDILWQEMASRDQAALDRVTRYFDDHRPVTRSPAH